MAIEAVEKTLLARLGRGAIVGQQDDDAVIEQPLVAQPIENAADLPVAMLDEAGIDRHIAREDRLFVIGQIVPRPVARRARRQPGAGGNQPNPLHADEALLADRDRKSTRINSSQQSTYRIPYPA